MCKSKKSSPYKLLKLLDMTYNNEYLNEHQPEIICENEAQRKEVVTVMEMMKRPLYQDHGGLVVSCFIDGEYGIYSENEYYPHIFATDFLNDFNMK